MKTCIACGMPMKEAADFAGNDTSNEYCVYCARPDGTMQSFEEKKAGLIHFTIKSQGIDEQAAARLVEHTMRRLPAWKDHFVTE